MDEKLREALMKLRRHFNTQYREVWPFDLWCLWQDIERKLAE